MSGLIRQVLYQEGDDEDSVRDRAMPNFFIFSANNLKREKTKNGVRHKVTSVCELGV